MAEYDKYLPEILEALKSIKPLKIILIGSYADGTVDEDSDLDLVVILDKTSVAKNYQEKMDNKLLVRRCIYEFSKMIPIDLIVYTKGEFQQITELGTSFYREIIQPGKYYMKKQAESWLLAAKDDLNVIKEILDNNELTNMVAFHAHHLIEKSFKAILEEYKGQVPKMHSIITLKEKSKHFINIPVNQDIFDKLNELYIDSRYPSEIGLLPNGKPSITEAENFFKEASHIFRKISEKLRKEPA